VPAALQLLQAKPHLQTVRQLLPMAAGLVKATKMYPDGRATITLSMAIVYASIRI